MVRRSTEKRLAEAEQRLRINKPTVHEVFVEGGLTKGMYRQASIGGARAIEPDPDEDFSQFRQRVLAIALNEGAKSIVYGGLPDDPVEWETPPGQKRGD